VVLVSVAVVLRAEAENEAIVVVPDSRAGGATESKAFNSPINTRK